MYRGHLRLALLRCLMDGEMHGLKMIHKIKDVTQGDWQPSPGSVYPILQEFENISLVKKRGSGRSVYYSLTEKGKETFEHLNNEVKRQMNFLDWVMKTGI
jgi:DNA-binding PadR family transcriptional regulator